MGAVATRLADAIAGNAVLFIAIDEQRALAVAGALRAASPDALIVHVPSSDALPGDRAPPSPANAGRRATALHLLRQRDCKKPVCLVTTVEAAIRLYPSPAAFDVAPPRLKVGDAIDAAELSDALTEIGYIHDGEEAVVKVDAFPYQRHGFLAGKLTFVSEQSFASGAAPGDSAVGSASAGAVHHGRIELTNTDLRNLPPGAGLIPGMTMSAEIKVGARRAITFFLYPLLRGMGESLREP